MPDVTTLSMVGAAALTEGVKFLFSQAGEVLKLWRKRKEAKQAQLSVEETEEVEIQLPPEVFEGELTHPQVHFDAVAKLEEQLRGLRKDLMDLADGTETLEDRHDAYAGKIDALRQCLEAVFRQRLTFKGEDRSRLNLVVEAAIDINEIAGYAAAVSAESIESGEIRGKVTAREAKAGSVIKGVDAKIIGGRKP